MSEAASRSASPCLASLPRLCPTFRPLPSSTALQRAAYAHSHRRQCTATRLQLRATLTRSRSPPRTRPSWPLLHSPLARVAMGNSSSYNLHKACPAENERYQRCYSMFLENKLADPPAAGAPVVYTRNGVPITDAAESALAADVLNPDSPNYACRDLWEDYKECVSVSREERQEAGSAEQSTARISALTLTLVALLPLPLHSLCNRLCSRRRRKHTSEGKRRRGAQRNRQRLQQLSRRSECSLQSACSCLLYSLPCVPFDAFHCSSQSD